MKQISELKIEGLRGDLVLMRAAKAVTALENRIKVSCKDIKKIIGLCLRHRLYKDSKKSINATEKIEKTFEKIFC